MLVSTAAIDSVRALAARLAERLEQLLQPRRLRARRERDRSQSCTPHRGVATKSLSATITVNRVTLQMPPRHCKRLPWLSARHVPLQTKTISTLLRRKKFAPDGSGCLFSSGSSPRVRWAWQSISLDRRLAVQS